MEPVAAAVVGTGFKWPAEHAETGIRRAGERRRLKSRDTGQRHGAPEGFPTFADGHNENCIVEAVLKSNRLAAG